MILPKQKDVELPLLLEIEAMGGDARSQDIYPKVAAHFPQITEADLKETIELWLESARELGIKIAERETVSVETK